MSLKSEHFFVFLLRCSPQDWRSVWNTSGQWMWMALLSVSACTGTHYACRLMTIYFLSTLYFINTTCSLLVNRPFLPFFGMDGLSTRTSDSAVALKSTSFILRSNLSFLNRASCFEYSEMQRETDTAQVEVGTRGEKILLGRG